MTLISGCLSDITINALELLALATSLESSDVVIQDVLLGKGVLGCHLCL